MKWPAHPDDEWIDVTALGDAAPQYVLGRSGVDIAIGVARAAYVAGQIDVDEFESEIDAAIGRSTA